MGNENWRKRGRARVGDADRAIFQPFTRTGHKWDGADALWQAWTARSARGVFAI